MKERGEFWGDGRLTFLDSKTQTPAGLKAGGSGGRSPGDGIKEHCGASSVSQRSALPT